MGILKKTSFQNTPQLVVPSTSSANRNKISKLRKRRKSFFSFISPSDVTEESLEVWRHLPPKIRQDPSMASFQLQQEKLHGKSYLKNILKKKIKLTKISIFKEKQNLKNNLNIVFLF